MYRLSEYEAFYVWAYQTHSTLPDGKHQKNPRMVDTILIANADIEPICPHHGGLALLLHHWASGFTLTTKHDSMKAGIFYW